MNLPATEVALVLADTCGEPKENGDRAFFTKKLKVILERFQEHGANIIHAPDHPVVDKYPQRWSLKKELHDFIKQFPARAANPSPAFLNRPPFSNEARVKYRRFVMKQDLLIFQWENWIYI